MDTTPAVSANDLSTAAFGGNPGLWPLPPASGAHDLWVRAVAAGGQGRYASGFADLDRLERLPRSATTSSLALSTRASFLRQLGWHTVARGWDGRAAAVAAGSAEPGAADAGADALIGLAADALGVGRFAASARALEGAAELIGAAATSRPAVRMGWVSAELAMFRGDGTTAVAHARRAVDLAAGFGSVRHRVKSHVVLAAALCSSGDLDAARQEGDLALADATRFGLVPLQWAVACLLADIGSQAYPAARIRAVRDASAEAVTRWGGVWRPR
ncbi:hypothetical protein [Mycolicibacterium gilvum]|uniref:ATP-dependent transcriptional regulator n=1 Tax=Mycolicibacterium gilvum (strain DSM 45189 / LMG 24558 / Spyr1) TaxID=278137 RepID=E6TDB8_MYCSR|nr:hypothetical protein [Mycolicibacterium gilvum]ADU00887.1 hypothetical protein Mspyr1_43300 [Mycolicibacterium gilvum Spyr1]